MTKQDLDLLKSNLPTGWASALHTKTGLSYGLIYKVLSGEKSNIEIVTHALKLAKSTKSISSNLKRQIKAL